MNFHPTRPLILLFALITLTAIGCGYGPDTSLPTDNVGPMLDRTTTPLTEWSSNAYRLVTNYNHDTNEFLVIDVEEPGLYRWTPNFSSVASIVNQHTEIFYDINFDSPANLPNIDQTNFQGMVISDDGKIAKLPLVEIRGLHIGSDSDGPWYSLDGRWRIHYTFAFGLYSTSRPITPINEERLDFNSPSLSNDPSSAWILAWNPDNTQFVMSAENEQTFLFDLNGRETRLPGEAGNMAFEKGQWLADGRLILMKEEKLFALDMAANTFEQLTGLGRVLWFGFSPDMKYLATYEKVDCEYRADNDSWFPGNEYCNEDFFFYEGTLENRQRLTVDSQYQLHSPVWLPIDGVSQIWEVRSPR